MKGEYVIGRFKDAGVFFGKCESVIDNVVTMSDVRKLHYWDGAAAVEEISQIGTKKPDNCRFTVSVPSMDIFNPIQLLPCTNEAIEVIKSVPEWKS